MGRGGGGGGGSLLVLTTFCLWDEVGVVLHFRDLDLFKILKVRIIAILTFFQIIELKMLNSRIWGPPTLEGRSPSPPPLKKPQNPQINTKKIKGEERKQRERREVQFPRLKLS